MKTATLDKNYPKLTTFGGLRQGTLTFARHCLRAKRAKSEGHRWRIWSFRHPCTGKMWHCLAVGAPSMNRVRAERAIRG